MTLPNATRNCQRHNLGTILLLLISGTLAVAAATSQLGDGKILPENCETVVAHAEVGSSTSVLHEPCGEHAESMDQGEARRVRLVRSLSDDIGENLHATLAESAQETTLTKFDKVVIAHAVMGSVAWMIISPAAILLARASTSSLRAHTIAQSLVTGTLTIVTVILGCIATSLGPSTGHFESDHQRMGLALVILLCLQLTLARVIGSHHEVDVRIRPVSETAHKFVSIALTALGFAQIWLGMDLYEEKVGRRVPLAVKVIWAVIVGLFSILLVILSVTKGTRPKENVSMKDSLKLKRRKATVHLSKHRERGIRSDGIWVGIMDDNISGSTFISEYSDASVFKEASKDPGINTIQERMMNYFPDNPESIPTLWLNALERDVPVDPSTLPVYQPALTNSNRAPATSTDLSLPSTSVSPLVPILEEVEEVEEGEADLREDRGEQDGEEGRPMSWISSTANSVHTESSAQLSQSRNSRSRSIKRKPVPIT